MWCDMHLKMVIMFSKIETVVTFLQLKQIRDYW